MRYGIDSSWYLTHGSKKEVPLVGQELSPEPLVDEFSIVIPGLS